MRGAPTKISILFKRGLILFLFCIAASYLTLALQIPGKFGLADGLPVPSTGFARDGWLHDRAEIQFPGISKTGNTLRISFDANRPGDPAQLDVFLCGVPKGRWVIGSGEQKLRLNGDCTPQTVSFHIVNPIQVHATDPRQLGSIVRQVRITSQFGLPIPKISQVMTTASVFFTIAAAVYAATGILVLSIVALIGISYFAHTYTSSPYILHSLWMICTGLFLGIGIGRKVFQDRRRTFRNPYDSSQFNIYSIGVLFAVILGGYLRYGGVSFGLPDHFHPDEIPKAQVILRMYETGSFNPQYFLHPSLLLYLSYAVSLLLNYFGLGEFYQTTFLAGRIVSATAGTASIFFIYAIGRMIYGQSAGAIAAALLAVFPLHVTSSRYMKEDALLLSLVLLTFALVLRAAQSGRARDLYAAAFCAGLCASAKYSGAIASFFVILAPWIRTKSLEPDPKFFSSLLLAGACTVFGFILCTPYSILDFDSFIAGINFERKHMLRGHTESISAWSQLWTYHWGRSVVPGISAVTALFSICAVGILLYRKKFEDLLLILIILFFYLPAEWVKAKPAPQPERYILPCLPFFALIVAEGSRVIWHYGKRITALTCIALCIMFPLKRSIDLYRELIPDTRTRAAQWIDEHIPPQSKIVSDFVPYSPRIDPQKHTVVNNPLLPVGTWLDRGKLKTYEVDYIILSSLSYDRFFSQPGQPAGMRIQFRRVFSLPLVQEFKPEHGTYGFHNPTIRIYKVSNANSPLFSGQ